MAIRFQFQDEMDIIGGPEINIRFGAPRNDPPRRETPPQQHQLPQPPSSELPSSESGNPNLKTLKEITTGFELQTEIITEMTSDIKIIDSNVNNAITHVMNEFGKEADTRQKLTDSFRGITELLRNCKNDRNAIAGGNADILKRFDDYQEQINKATREHTRDAERLNAQIQNLLTQLTETKQQVTVLTTEIETLKFTKNTLERDTKELQTVNSGYTQEIQKQMSIYEHLKAAVGLMKDNLVKLSKAALTFDKSSVLPQSILLEIRNDVFHGDAFKKIRQLTDPKVIEESIKQMIDTKWIPQLQKLKKDLEVIVENLKTLHPLDSNKDKWTDYLTQLKTFTSSWSTHSTTIVGKWAKEIQSMLTVSDAEPLQQNPTSTPTPPTPKR